MHQARAHLREPLAYALLINRTSSMEKLSLVDGVLRILMENGRLSTFRRPRGHSLMRGTCFASAVETNPLFRKALEVFVYLQLR